jgi:molybdenum cofactor guanylyltransferase
MIVGVLLAGGQSSRMGRDKAGIVVEGKTLAERAIETLRAVCERVVVLGHGRGCPSDVPRIPDDGEGPARALAKLPTGDVYVVLPVDMPLVRAEHLRVLMEARGERRAAHYENEPLPLVFVGAIARDAAPALRGMIETMDPVVVKITDRLMFANLNTPEDLDT